MNEKLLTLKEIHTNFCNFIDCCSTYSFYTRLLDLQHQKVLDCDEYLKFIKQYKILAINKKIENDANQLFHMQCVINALRSFLLMWIHLKEGNFQESWMSLVDAQEYLAIALKIEDYEGIRCLESRLKGAEEAVFSNWHLYNSPGFLETVGDCSICYKLFTNCEHEEEKIYMGRLCQRINKKILSIDHIALVKNPHDRRCINTKISNNDGNEIDNFTLEETGKKNRSEGYNFEGTVFCTRKLDIL